MATRNHRREPRNDSVQSCCHIGNPHHRKARDSTVAISIANIRLRLAVRYRGVSHVRPMTGNIHFREAFPPIDASGNARSGFAYWSRSAQLFSQEEIA